MIFLHIFVVGMQIVIVRMDWTLLYCSKLHCDNDSEFIPKLRPFRNFSSTLSKAPSALFHQPGVKAFIFFVQIAIDSRSLSYFSDF